MNWRIYKKQSKRALQLLIANGHPLNPKNIFKSTAWEHPVQGMGVDGALVIGWWSSTPDGTDWEERCVRAEWAEIYYWSYVVGDHYFITGEEPMPRATLEQRRERFSTRMLPPGWEWRGRRAVQKHDGRRKSPPRPAQSRKEALRAPPERRLTDEAQQDRDMFEVNYEDRGCTCFISPPCGWCTHPGYPHNQETDDCWTTEPVAA